LCFLITQINYKPDATKGVVNNTPCILPDVDKYQYKSCYEGWYYDNKDDCKVHTCPSNYPYPSNPGETAGTVILCQKGASTVYSYNACNNGWSLSGGLIMLTLVAGSAKLVSLRIMVVAHISIIYLFSTNN